MQNSIRLYQFYNASSKFFQENLAKKFAFCTSGAIVIGKELENSVTSGSCHRQFGSNSHYRFFRFVDDRTRKARCMTLDMFSTSANLFLFLRENRLQKINNQKTVTLSKGGYNAHRHNEHLKDATPHPAHSRSVAFPLQIIHAFAHAPVS